jgi:cobalt-zinc-cadmium efflux system outer membrane protein
MKKYVTLFLLYSLTLSAGEVLTWDEALVRVMDSSPRLKVFSNEIGEKSGLLIQSESLPNPVFAYSVENVFGYRNWRGWKSAESRYELGQLVELGGKRGYRTRAASYQVFAVQTELEVEKLRLLHRLSKLFAEASAEQEQLKLLKGQAIVAEKVFEVVRSKAEEGRGSVIDQKKAEIEYYTSKLDVEKAHVNFMIAKERLATLWGDTVPDFEFIDWPFYEVESPASLEICQSELINHPEWVRIQFELLSSKQNICLERAERIPDITLTVGYKTQQDTHDKGFVLGASMPLQVFNQNQGNIQKARSESQKIYERGVEVSLNLKLKQQTSHKEWVRAYIEVEQMRNTILKAADEAFEYSREGYQNGKYEFLNMLHAQDTLFEVQKRYIQALLNYHKSRAEVKFLISEDGSL